MPQRKTASPLPDLNRIIRANRIAEFRSPALALGMRPVEFLPGKSLWVWETQPQSALNPFGAVQGGYLAVFVDEILATAMASMLEEGEWAVTAEIKLSYLRALFPQRLEGRGRAIRRTRSVAFLEAEVRNAGGEAAVIANSTWIISQSEPQ